MILVSAVLIVLVALLLLLNVPVAAAIALATYFAVAIVEGNPSYVVASRMANGIDSFALLAIPFFVLAGLLMGRGGIARRLMEFAAALVGRFPGGLAYVNTLSCMLFGSMSGSAAAAISSIGSFMLPEMRKKNYNNEFIVAVTTTSATTGLLIPPSNIMIVYSVAAGSVSIAAMFLAGVLPGIVVGLGIMAVCLLKAMRSNFGDAQPASILEVVVAFNRAFLSLLLVVLVFGGIIAGVFTATEASAVAVVYSFILAVILYREVEWRDLPSILVESGVTTSIVMLLVGACSGLSWIMTMANIPQAISDSLIHLSSNRVVILILINVLLLMVGTFMDITPAVLIFTPILLPVVRGLGMSDLHFGIMIIANLCIGLCTPPVGTCLFIGCSVGETSISKATPAFIPFYLAMVLSLALITFIPQLSMALPRFFGF